MEPWSKDRKLNGISLNPKGTNQISMHTAFVWAMDKGKYVHNLSPVNLISFTFERKLSPKLLLTGTYGKWYLFRNRFDRNSPSYEISYYTPPASAFTDRRRDVIWKRRNYSLADIQLGYIVREKPKWLLSTHLGPSLTWCTDVHMYYKWRNPEPFSDEIWYVSEKRATYFGIVGTARFTYKLWKERIVAGAFLTGRYYPSGLISMKWLNLGFSVGYRF